MTDRCRCECHCGGVKIFHFAPATDEPIAALTCCDLCAPLHRGVWTIYRRPRVVKRTWIRDIPQADGNTDSEGAE